MCSMNISVFGCGRWGSFIGWYLDKVCGAHVLLWGREGSANMAQLLATRHTGVISLEDTVALATDLSDAVDFGQTLVISISAQQLRTFMHQLAAHDLAGKDIVLCMKGLEAGTGKRLSRIVAEYTDVPVAIWVGPGHVQNFAAGVPGCMVIDSEVAALKNCLVDAFSSPLIRLYYGNDLVGNEIGAAAKNVVGIAAGMLDGYGFASLKGALMARGAREISRLIAAMGGNAMSAYGLAHLGDYEATLFSEYSHNRRFGELFIRGEKFEKLAEGVSTAAAIVALGETYGVDLPICNAVFQALNTEADPRALLSDLFLRDLKKEF